MTRNKALTAARTVARHTKESQVVWRRDGEYNYERLGSVEHHLGEIVGIMRYQCGKVIYDFRNKEE